MLPFLEELREENFDCISFLPGKHIGELNIEGGTYLDKGEEITGNMGCVYHISLFKQKKDLSIEMDHFDSILIDPLVYISHIIKSGFFGFVSKKTTTSEEFNQDMIEKMKESFT
jgi:hypothetical protein